MGALVSLATKQLTDENVIDIVLSAVFTNDFRRLAQILETNEVRAIDFTARRFTVELGDTEKDRVLLEDVSLLHIAAFQGYIHVLEVLLTSRVYMLDMWDHQRQTALHYTCRRAFPRCSSLLCDNRFSTHIQDVHGKVPLHYALENSRMADTSRALIALGGDELTKAFAVETGYAPLHVAIQQQNLPIVACVLARIGHVVAPSRDQWTPLMLAVRFVLDDTLFGQFFDLFRKYKVTRQGLTLEVEDVISMATRYKRSDQIIGLLCEID